MIKTFKEDIMKVIFQNTEKNKKVFKFILKDKKEYSPVMFQLDENTIKSIWSNSDTVMEVELDGKVEEKGIIYVYLEDKIKDNFALFTEGLCDSLVLEADKKLVINGIDCGDYVSDETRDRSFKGFTEVILDLLDMNKYEWYFVLPNKFFVFDEIILTEAKSKWIGFKRTALDIQGNVFAFFISSFDAYRGFYIDLKDKGISSDKVFSVDLDNLYVNKSTFELIKYLGEGRDFDFYGNETGTLIKISDNNKIYIKNSSYELPPIESYCELDFKERKQSVLSFQSKDMASILKKFKRPFTKKFPIINFRVEKDKLVVSISDMEKEIKCDFKQVNDSISVNLNINFVLDMLKIFKGEIEMYIGNEANPVYFVNKENGFRYVCMPVINRGESK
jgi:hypothetical protein